MTEQTTPLDLDAIEVRHGQCASRHVVARRGEMEPTMLALAESAEDVPALVAEVRRLTAALAEAYEARDIAQGQWRWYQARAERAEAALREAEHQARMWEPNWRAANAVANDEHDLAKRVVPNPTLGRSWVDVLGEHLDAVTTERDTWKRWAEGAFDRAEAAEGHLAKAAAERDEARRARKVSQDLARQARRTADAIQQATRERAEYAEQQRDEAEAAVARARALLDRPLIPSALLRDALDGVDAGGEA